jgi:glucose dehydrogenase
VGTQRTRGLVFALNTSTGKEVWRTDEEAVGSNVVSGVVLADERILILESSAIVALDPDGGGLVWRTEVVNPRRTPFVAVGVGTPAPVSADGQVVAVDESGLVYALVAETGAQRWDFALNDSSPVSPPLLTEDHVLVPTDSGTLYALDRETGHLVWRTDPVGPLLRGLADAGDSIVGVAGIDDHEVVAFEPDPDGALIDEPSPTTFDLGRLLAGFAAGGLSLGLVALLLARPLQRRLGPALAAGQTPIEEDVE